MSEHTPLPIKYKLTRDVTKKECHWLDKTFKKGSVVLEYQGYTYGCISDNGIAVSNDGKEPFFEIPIDALQALNESE